MPTPKLEARNRFAKWYQTEVKDPPTLALLRAELHVSPNTITKWKKKLEEDIALVKYIKAQQTEAGKAQRIIDVENVLYKQAIEGKSKHAELYLKMHGLLIEKTENKHLVMTLDDYDKISREAESKRSELRKRLRPGVVEVGDSSLQTRPPLLLDEIRQD